MKVIRYRGKKWYGFPGRRQAPITRHYPSLRFTNGLRFANGELVLGTSRMVSGCTRV
jgi:hypothetical protein